MVKVKYKKIIRHDSSFVRLSTYGTGEVFLLVGWGGESKALMTLPPAKARDLGKALIKASKKAKWVK